ncbi:hypothetical protein ACLOJK_024337, partial [Asimina triloba]
TKPRRARSTLLRDPALRRCAARQQSSSIGGRPSRVAAALDECPVVPFSTTCCTSRTDNDDQNNGRCQNLLKKVLKFKEAKRR